MSSRATKILELALAARDPNVNSDQQSTVNYFDLEPASNTWGSNKEALNKTSEDEHFTITKKTDVASTSGISNLNNDYQSDMSFDDSEADPDFCLFESDKECETSEQDVEEARKQDENDHALDNKIEEKLCTATVPQKYARKLKQIRKTCRNTGKEYTTMSGKVVKERKSKPLTNCRNKCAEKITSNEKDKLFQDYWKLGTHDKRAAYVSSMIDICEKKTTKINVNVPIENLKCRQVTYTYYVEIKGKRIIVCKKCFRDIFDENTKFITIAMKKKRAAGNSLEQCDKRGKGPPVHKHSAETKDLILKHINSFPAYESHYTRKRTQKKYLGSELNLSKMYQLYRETVPHPVGRTLYESIFRSLNLSFKKPKADTCQKCDSLNMKLTVCTDEEKLTIQSELHTHQQEAEIAYSCKSTDKRKAKEDPTFLALVFDLQRLPTPYLQTNVAFYKRQLWTFNLTIHNLKDGQATCYMWHECIGGRGGNQIASCLFKHLNNLDPQIKHIVLYSDTCGGQNKNTHVAAMFIMLLQQNKNINVIDHKFLIPGHTHMECDSDHSVIHCKKNM